MTCESESKQCPTFKRFEYMKRKGLCVQPMTNDINRCHSSVKLNSETRQMTAVTMRELNDLRVEFKSTNEPTREEAAKAGAGKRNVCQFHSCLKWFGFGLSLFTRRELVT